MTLPDRITEKELLALAQVSLRVDGISYGRALLNEIHCPPRFLVQEMFSINQFIGGSVTVRKDTEETVIPEGAAVLIPAGVPLRFTNNNPGHTVSIHNHIQCSLMETIDPIPLLDLPISTDVNIGRKVGEINAAFREAEPLKEKNFLQYIAARHRLAMQLLEIVISVSSLKPDANEQLARSGRLQPAFRYIRKNLAERISIADVAGTLYVSEPRLFELFRETLGVSPGRYILQQRMRRAQELLVNTGLRISEVGESVGYGDQFHFSRVFRKNFNVSPAQFRKQWRA